MKWTLLLLAAICANINSVAAQAYENRMRIDSVDRSYVFQVTDDRPHLRLTHLYFWFKSGRIHQTQGGYNGKVLDGVYKVIDKEQRLLEQGRFHMGKKTGTWLTWYENGRLKSCMRYRSRDNKQYLQTFDRDGKTLQKGYNKNGQFTGYRLETENDSIVTVTYKNGIRRTKEKSKQP